MTIFKKELLFNMIEEGKVDNFTIIGVPCDDLYNAYFKNCDLVTFFNSKGINCTILDKWDKTDISVYFPNVGTKRYCDVCSISVSRAVSKVEYINILELFKDVLDCYQVNIPPRIVNKVIGLYENEPIVFSDMLMLIRDNQSDIARKINKSRQLIADIKSGKAKLTLENLSLLVNEYPLLPWINYIQDAKLE